jgi:hypothetical protein
MGALRHPGTVEEL